MFPGPIRRPQRTISRHHQTPIPTVGQQLHLGQVRVALYLSDAHTHKPGSPQIHLPSASSSIIIITNTVYLKNSGFDPGDRQDVIDLLAVEVGQADGPNKTLLHQFLHGGPGHLVVGVIIQQGAVLFSGERNVSSSSQTKEDEDSLWKKGLRSGRKFSTFIYATSEGKTVN